MLASDLAGRAPGARASALQRHRRGGRFVRRAGGRACPDLLGERRAGSAGSWCWYPSPWPVGDRPVAERRGRAARALARGRGRLVRSRPTVSRLAALFALDSFGGGFTVSAFVAYWLRARFDASPAVIGVDVLRHRAAADRVVPGRTPAGGPVRAAAHHGVHPPAVQPAAGGGGLRPQPSDGGRAAARPAPCCRRWTSRPARPT